MSEHVHDENCNHDHDHEGGIDLIRLTYQEGQLHCSLDPSLFADEPGTWGIVLADLTRNISEALTEHNPGKRDEVLAAIRANYLEALSSTIDGSTK